MTQEKGRHKNSLPPPPSLLNVKESAFLTCVSAQTQKKSGECCPIQKKENIEIIFYKAVTRKRDIAVIDSVLMVWVDFSSLCCEDVLF